ncbi:hypothetical protein BofuT4_P092100.1 [Botrytis cinerea T4]|uniref:Uncharacterized protein n=1 Tax=Botryotinia fuckeliana (strain T4) TaxID=999810 RepID=G2YEQ3_BOTF4|nr:hypothetical protein BofuT4_P092100.1 [Botrytis cinerea T4]
MGWIGLDWTGLDWIGLDWIEFALGYSQPSDKLRHGRDLLYLVRMANQSTPLGRVLRDADER